MDGEVCNFIKDWFLIFVSLSYCFAIGKIIPQGTKRVFCFLPVISLFLALPLNLHTIHLQGFTAFFISWLANFKLLLYAFGNGPLSNPSISFNHFLLLTCFPIKIQQNPPQKSHQKQNPVLEKGQKSLLNYAIKGILLAVFVRIYDYRNFIHPKIILILYSFHIYFATELILAIVAALARAMLGLELEPQFNEPYLSTSLQDFWGRRWNMMVTSILRPTVYNHILNTCAPTIGRRWAPLLAIMGTFVVSGIMHEIIFYYLDLERSKPTWEITWFFILHGISLVIEVALKKIVNRKWKLPRFISTALTIGYIIVTGFWLFMPQILHVKADTRAFEEYSSVSTFFKNVGSIFLVSFDSYSGEKAL